MRAVNALSLTLGLALATTAHATVDCQRVQTKGVRPKAVAVIAYRDPASSTAASSEELMGIENSLRQGMLSNYMNSLGVKSDSLNRLDFLICNQRTETTLTENRDIKILKSAKVALAIWRAPEQGRNGVFYAVIPKLMDIDDTELPDESIVAAEPVIPAGEPLKVWVQGIQQDNAALMALIGLGLGFQYLESGEGLNAKLALCKSRKDLRRAFDSLIRPQQPAKALMTVVDKLINEAQQQISVKGLRADQDLQKSIDAACAAP